MLRVTDGVEDSLDALESDAEALAPVRLVEILSLAESVSERLCDGVAVADKEDVAVSNCVSVMDRVPENETEREAVDVGCVLHDLLGDALFSIVRLVVDDPSLDMESLSVRNFDAVKVLVIVTLKLEDAVVDSDAVTVGVDDGVFVDSSVDDRDVVSDWDSVGFFETLTVALDVRASVNVTDAVGNLDTDNVEDGVFILVTECVKDTSSVRDCENEGDVKEPDCDSDSDFADFVLLPRTPLLVRDRVDSCDKDVDIDTEVVIVMLALDDTVTERVVEGVMDRVSVIALDSLTEKDSVPVRVRSFENVEVMLDDVVFVWVDDGDSVADFDKEADVVRLALLVSVDEEVNDAVDVIDTVEDAVSVADNVASLVSLRVADAEDEIDDVFDLDGVPTVIDIEVDFVGDPSLDRLVDNVRERVGTTDRVTVCVLDFSGDTDCVVDVVMVADVVADGVTETDMLIVTVGEGVAVSEADVDTEKEAVGTLEWLNVRVRLFVPPLFEMLLDADDGTERLPDLLTVLVAVTVCVPVTLSDEDVDCETDTDGLNEKLPEALVDVVRVEVIVLDVEGVSVDVNVADVDDVEVSALESEAVNVPDTVGALLLVRVAVFLDFTVVTVRVGDPSRVIDAVRETLSDALKDSSRVSVGLADSEKDTDEVDDSEVERLCDTEKLPISETVELRVAVAVSVGTPVIDGVEEIVLDTEV